MRLRYLGESIASRAMVTIVDNGSTDDTALVAQRLTATISCRAAALHRFSLPRGWAFRPTSPTANLQAAGAPLSSR